MTHKEQVEALQLADEIVDSISELAGGKIYPDLLGAVRRLASLSIATATAPAAAQSSINDALAALDWCEQTLRAEYGGHFTSPGLQSVAAALRGLRRIDFSSIATAPAASEPVATMVYFIRRGSLTEDHLAVVGDPTKQVDPSLITRTAPLYTAPPSASSDEQDARRYRWLREKVYVDTRQSILRIADVFLRVDEGASVAEQLDAALDSMKEPKA